MNSRVRLGDNIIRYVLDGKNRGIPWTFTEQLEDADDFCFLSVRHTNMQGKLDDLVEEAGLEVNVEKIEALKVNTNRQDDFLVRNERIELVHSLSYLGSFIAADGGARTDIEAKVAKAKAAFTQLRKIWNFNFPSLNTKTQIYKSNMLSILLYGRGPRRILKMWWPNTIGNSKLMQR